MIDKLKLEELQELREIYGRNLPKFAPSFGILSHHIERFLIHPESAREVKFLGVKSCESAAFLLSAVNQKSRR
jgi:hypothetical protein